METITGIANFRDMGGIVNKNNMVIKDNMIFRSAKLSDATKEDIQLMKKMNITKVFDYRSYDEAVQSLDPAIEGINTYVIPALQNHDDQINTADIAAFMKTKDISQFSTLATQMYQLIPFDNLAYKMLMAELQSKDKGAFLHHCTAGRDRTGVATALVLLLLDVDEATIMKDYLRSNDELQGFIKGMINAYVKDEQMVDTIAEAINLHPQYLNAMFEALKTKYGTYDNYFLVEYGITPEIKKQIQNKYLTNK